MKTAMRKSDPNSRTITQKKNIVQKKSDPGLQINDNRQSNLAQMKLMESLQAKEDIQFQAGPEEEEMPKA